MWWIIFTETFKIISNTQKDLSVEISDNSKYKYLKIFLKSEALHHIMHRDYLINDFPTFFYIYNHLQDIKIKKSNKKTGDSPIRLLKKRIFLLRIFVLMEILYLKH